MLRRLPGGSSAGRVALVALVALLVGAALWMVSGDEDSPGTTRLEATRSSIDPLLGQASTGPWDSVAPATPAPGSGPTAPAAPAAETPPGEAPTSGTAAPAPAPAASQAPIGRADSLDGGVDGGAGSDTEPAPAAGTGTGPARSLADASGGASSAPSASTETTAPPTTSTPTTQSTTTTTTSPPATGRSRTPSAEAEVVPLTNADRSNAGLGTLSRSSCLDSIASGYAEQMARSGVLAHNPGAGPAIAGCRPGATWGDNVGTSKPCDPDLLEEEWMDSASHRRNILTGAFTLMGVGAWTDEKGACWVQVLFSS